VLVLEFVAVFQWFNPFFWMFRRALRENHEFLADQAVISHGTAPSRYKQILLNQYVGEQVVIANNFNYSLIKNRIKMMSKIKSKRITHVKFLVGFILAASLVAIFACEQKESVKTEVIPADMTVTIEFQGQPLQISGDSDAIEDLKSFISKEKMGIPPPPPPPSPGSSALTFEKDVFMVVDQMPEFTGGVEALRNFIAQSVKYPTEASGKGIQGKVFVSFVVNKDGSVSNAQIARGVDPSIDAEALRVVNSLPKWTPGKHGGKVVAVQYTIPINFALQ
jgi:TonB family protein